VSEISDWAALLRAGQVDSAPGALPPHYPSCFGCGPQAEYGLHLVCRLDGETLRTSYTFSDKHEGAPGIAHGGAVAALVDDVCGFSLFVIQKPAVTRKLEVEYLRPVLVGVEYDVVARVDRTERRKISVSCVGTAPDGTPTFRGNALFVIVDLSHFDVVNRPDDQPPVAL
jgi:acyl-coenzyme A thioesterase PaaI-like protein